MKRQIITPGSILEIHIEKEYYVYAQILLNGLGYAFFDFKSKVRLMDLNTLLNCKVLFILMVYDDVITKGVWLKVGKLPIREELLIQPMKFIQDALNPDKFQLYNPNTGEISSATKKDCKGLERASVWEANHVEDRIRDHYLGVPCAWLKEDYELFGIGQHK